MQSSYDVYPLIMRMPYPFSQGLFKLMNRDCYADRCDDQISFFSLSARNPSHRCFITKGEAIQDNYTIELCDSGHGVFQCVLLSPVTLNRIL